jgi:deoxyribodipyrimidine photo-lyase
LNQERIKFLKKGKQVRKPVLYWMSRDQRINDNWALLYAQEQAFKYEVPLIVIFCLTFEFLNALPRIYKFMIQGLDQIYTALTKLNISFILLQGDPTVEIPKFIEKYKIGKLIVDFSPLRVKSYWIKHIIKTVTIPIIEIDAHNIIPCWKASPKMEYSAHTFRSKVRSLLQKFLEDYPSIKSQNIKWDHNLDNETENLLNHVLSNYENESLPKVPFNSGEKYASDQLNLFLNSKIKNYTAERNDPTKDAQSNLSPYLHFGQISSQRVVKELMRFKKLGDLKGSIYDEVIVRKELSDNFCYYNQKYDTFEGFPEWAKKTLINHMNDKREFHYTLKDLESANTHDMAWNAAQIQMVKEGKMHGYMRMYWSKKILEWTVSPERAIEYAQNLNDKYELDGRDPNGYVGIAWSIGGVHDRPWTERPIFGKVRYMNYTGLKRKFKIQNYIDRYLN